METGGYFLGDSDFIADFKEAIIDKCKHGDIRDTGYCFHCGKKVREPMKEAENEQT